MLSVRGWKLWIWTSPKKRGGGGQKRAPDSRLAPLS
jgi:hypothetical protein